MIVTAVAALAANRCAQALACVAASTLDLDYCAGQWVFSVIRDFVDCGILSISIGPFRINVTWPVTD